MNKLINDLFRPIDATWLAFFRIAFGLLMLFDIVQYFQRGWIQENYIDPIYHFKFYGFNWVQQLPGNGMFIYFFILALLSICIILGYKFRFAIFSFFLGYTYMWLIDITLFVEWNYLISLIAFLLTFSPAGKIYSLDNILSKKENIPSAPLWILFILRFQFAVVYIFGGIHKLNPDWIKGDLVRGWLAYGYSVPFFGKIVSHNEWLIQFLTWLGIGIDLLIVPLLLIRASRPWALAIAILFHLHNAHRFLVDIFPFFMIAGTYLFLDPQLFQNFFKNKNRTNILPAEKTFFNQRKNVIVALIIMYCFFQITIPLRHLFYPGNPNWTEEGVRFSWFLYTRHKYAEIQFTVVDQEDATYVLNKNSILSILTPRQYYYLSTYPHCILQFSHFLNQHLTQQGMKVKKIMANSLVQMNMREPQPIIDPNANLLEFKESLAHKNWINPVY